MRYINWHLHLHRVIHQPVSVVSQCGAGAWLNGMASRDQRRPAGSGSASEACSRWCSLHHFFCSFYIVITPICVMYIDRWLFDLLHNYIYIYIYTSVYTNPNIQIYKSTVTFLYFTDHITSLAEVIHCNINNKNAGNHDLGEQSTHRSTAAVSRQKRHCMLWSLVCSQQRSWSDILTSAVVKLVHITKQTHQKVEVSLLTVTVTVTTVTCSAGKTRMIGLPYGEKIITIC